MEFEQLSIEKKNKTPLIKNENIYKEKTQPINNFYYIDERVYSWSSHPLGSIKHSPKYHIFLSLFTNKNVQLTTYNNKTRVIHFVVVNFKAHVSH